MTVSLGTIRLLPGGSAAVERVAVVRLGENTAEAAAYAAAAQAAAATAAADAMAAAAASIASGASVAATIDARTGLVETFAAIATTGVSSGTKAIRTAGYAAAGDGGAGLYVNDALAASIGASHPLLCKQTPDSRWWRLAPVNGAITVEQAGAVGSAGTNDQPAIQAAITYANAAAIGEVRFTRSRYDLRAPTRTTFPFGLEADGNYMVIRENLRLIGVGPKRPFLRCLNSSGGTNDTITQTLSGSPWIGRLFMVKPNTTMDWVQIENLEIDGTVTYNPANRSNVNLTNKGFAVQDVTCTDVVLKNVKITNCAGEIYYTGGNLGIAREHLEDCWFEGSPQCALNPGTAAYGYYRNVTCGRAYQNEIVGGKGRIFEGGRWFDLSAAGSAGAAVMAGAGAASTGFVSGYHYSYPWRETDKSPAWIEFRDVVIDNCNYVALGGDGIRGRLTTIDTSITLTNYGKLCDIDLDVTAWRDRLGGNSPAVTINGIATDTTQVGGAPAGVYAERPRNIQLRVNARRTAYAKDNSRQIYAILRLNAGLIDHATCNFRVSGEASYPMDVLNTLPGTFSWPMLTVTPEFAPTSTESSFGSGNGLSVNANFNFTAKPGINSVSPSTAGTFDMTLVDTYGFRDGQIIRIYHTGPSAAVDRYVRIKRAANVMVPEDRVLFFYGDYIDLRWSSVRSAWQEVAYSTQWGLYLKGTTTWNPGAISAGAATSFTMTITGAPAGCAVERVYFGSSIAGLIWSAHMPSYQTLRVDVYNPTASPITPSSMTVDAIIRREKV